MTIAEALYAHLSTNAGLVALVSTRIYPIRAPQAVTHPSIVYFQVSESSPRVMGRRNFALPRFQFSCWGRSYSETKGVANKLKLALEGYGGTLGGSSGVPVRLIRLANEIDLPDSDGRLYHTALDFFIDYTEVLT